MKVAVIGSHGTGKTTLAKKLAKHLKFHFIPDAARKAYDKKFTINEKTSPETQFWILSKQLELERNTPTPWIGEKSLWDNLIYAKFSISDKEVHHVLDKIISANADYDLIFYLPIEFPLVADGIRSVDLHFQKAIDREYRQLLKRKEIEPIELRGSIPERFRSALKHIKTHRKFPKKSKKK